VRKLLPPLLLAVATFVGACTERAPAPPGERGSTASAEHSCEVPEVRQVVERLGERLKEVPLLAPDSALVRAIREAYAPLVTSDLLAAWTAEPSRAPGRDVSSPWPERIEVRTVVSVENGACRAEGEVLYVTSVELAQGGAVARELVTLLMVEDPTRSDGGWRISAYEATAAPTSDPTPGKPTASDAEAAANVIRRYYAALDVRDFRRAYNLWGDDGAASGQAFEAFAAGFAETARTEVEVGEPSRIEGAAGSHYVEVPMTIRAVTNAGEEQRFVGTYTLRRAVVDGATAEQRRWHLYTADVERIR
jgi:hypothetical protein